MIRNESQYDATKEYYVQLLLIHNKMKDDTRLSIHIMKMGSLTLWRTIRFLKDEMHLWEIQNNHTKQLYEDDEPDIRA